MNAIARWSAAAIIFCVPVAEAQGASGTPADSAKWLLERTDSSMRIRPAIPAAELIKAVNLSRHYEEPMYEVFHYKNLGMSWRDVETLFAVARRGGRDLEETFEMRVAQDLGWGEIQALYAVANAAYREDREILAMRRYEGMGWGEIAQTFGVFFEHVGKASPEAGEDLRDALSEKTVPRSGVAESEAESDDFRRLPFRVVYPVPKPSGR